MSVVSCGHPAKHYSVDGCEDVFNVEVVVSHEDYSQVEDQSEDEEHGDLGYSVHYT